MLEGLGNPNGPTTSAYCAERSATGTAFSVLGTTFSASDASDRCPDDRHLHGPLSARLVTYGLAAAQAHSLDMHAQLATPCTETRRGATCATQPAPASIHRLHRLAVVTAVVPEAHHTNPAIHPHSTDRSAKTSQAMLAPGVDQCPSCQCTADTRDVHSSILQHNRVIIKGYSIFDTYWCSGCQYAATSFEVRHSSG